MVNWDLILHEAFVEQQQHCQELHMGFGTDIILLLNQKIIFSSGFSNAITFLYSSSIKGIQWRYLFLLLGVVQHVLMYITCYLCNC